MIDLYGSNQISLKMYILDLNVMLISITSIVSSIIAVFQQDLNSMSIIFPIFLRAVSRFNFTSKIIFEEY